MSELERALAAGKVRAVDDFIFVTKGEIYEITEGERGEAIIATGWGEGHDLLVEELDFREHIDEYGKLVKPMFEVYDGEEPTKEDN